MSLIDLIPVILAGSAGLAAGGLVPTSGEKLMAYKVKKQMKKFVVYGFCGWTQWLYPVGVGASWMAAALEASVLKALFFMIISYVMFMVTYLDNRYRIIPNEITFAVLLSGLGYGLAAKGLSGLGGAAAGATAGFIICLLAAALTKGKNAVGAGDVKMLAACCCLGGVPGFMDVLLYMAAALGVYCVGGLLLKRLKLNSFFPMGGFIAMGLVLSLYPRQVEMGVTIFNRLLVGG